jgi:DNA-binding PadR family transcriptional regulator
VGERELLLLGMLMVQSQHGYQINEFIERNLSRVTDMKKPTAYALLERLSQTGYVRVRTEQQGKRPPRKVYSITSAGAILFLDLLRDNLARAERMTFAGDMGLMFLDHLPREEALDLLRQRLGSLDAQIGNHEQAPKHEHGLGVGLALEHILFLLHAERDWLAAAIARLQDTAQAAGVAADPGKQEHL